MDASLAQIALLFGLFMVLAAAVELVLESCRSIFEALGFTLAKGKVTLEEALKSVSQIAPSDTELAPKLDAITSVANQLEGVVKSRVAAITAIKAELASIKPELMAQPASSAVLARLTSVAARVKEEVDKSERFRVTWLRLIAAGIGGLIVWQSHLYVFVILNQVGGGAQLVQRLAESPVANIIVGGLAASAGSGYWHDKLDNVRGVKDALANVRKLAG